MNGTAKVVGGTVHPITRQDAALVVEDTAPGRDGECRQEAATKGVR